MIEVKMNNVVVSDAQFLFAPAAYNGDVNCSCQVDIRKKQKRFPHVWLVPINGISQFAALVLPVILPAQASFCTVPAVDSQDYADGDACCNSQ